MLWVFLLAVMTHSLSLASPRHRNLNEIDLLCSVCETDFCPKSGASCPLGFVPDPCGCCDVGICLLNEGDRCLDPKETPAISQTDLRKYGSCGTKMNCLQRTDLDANTGESICTCVESDKVCGSDNHTYENSCELDAFPSVHMLHPGPCESEPEIVTEPEDDIVMESQGLALDCEVRGFPVPTVSWKFQRIGGALTDLPGDDTSIIVQTRGGPETTMLTSWVQIVSARLDDAGVYICVASNRHGTISSVSNVQVQPSLMH